METESLRRDFWSTTILTKSLQEPLGLGSLFCTAVEMPPQRGPPTPTPATDEPLENLLGELFR